MAQTTTINLIPYKPFPGPSGAHISFDGDQAQAAAYYLANRDLQTITWNLTSQFSGNVKIQASLVTSPSNSDWFDIYDIDTNNKNGFHNLNGNFVWLRAKVTDWTEGAIQLVTVSY